jgi:hypothetical protein
MDQSRPGAASKMPPPDKRGCGFYGFDEEVVGRVSRSPAGSAEAARCVDFSRIIGSIGFS